MPQTEVVIVGEAYGKEEAASKRPFVGASGRELNLLLEEAGWFPTGTAARLNTDLWAAQNAYLPAVKEKIYNERDEFFRSQGIFLTNVLNLQPAGNRVEDCCGPKWGKRPAIRPGKYLRPEFTPELERLEQEIRHERPNLILGLGATALWFALGRGSITKHRGTVSSTPYGKFLPTFHPAYLMRGSWDQRPVVILDLIKGRRERAYAEVRRPSRKVYIPEVVSDMEGLLDKLSNAARLSIDIETAGNQITCIGFAWSTTETLVVPIFDDRKESRSYWSKEDEIAIWKLIARICRLPVPKVFQNGLYDIHFLWRRYGITCEACEHDTMLLSHALYPELSKGLGFLGSIYSDEPAWKLMRRRGKEATLKDEREE